MKRFIYFVFAVLLVQYTWAQSIIELSTGQTNNSLSTEPVHSSADNGGNVVVTYEFDAAKITEDNLFTGTYHWQYNTFGENHTQGEAAIPVKYDTFTYPQGTNVEVTIIEATYVDFNYELTPARQLSVENASESLSQDEVMPIQSNVGFSPNEIVKIEDQQTCRNTTTYWVKVSPVQYNHTNKTVRAYTKIQYKVIYSTTPQSRLSGIVITPAPVLQDTATVDYLIISTSEYSEAVNKLSTWKKQLGYNVTIKLNDSWTCESVKDAVYDTYTNNADECYAVIIGDHDVVPSNVSTLKPDANADSTHLTDLYYGCFGGTDDYFPEVYIGRIPATSSSEALAVVNKIIKYEETPPTNASFYNSGLNCAEFEDTNGDNKEDSDTRFIEVSEYIRNQLTNQGMDIKRAYGANSTITPLYYYDGSSIPTDLLKPGYSWADDYNNIISAIDEGCLYVMHIGHGFLEGWSLPYFPAGKMLNLNNGDLQPVVFSINCSTGNFQQTCFAEYFLKKFVGGCVGIIAPSSVTYTAFYETFAKKLFSNLWPTSEDSTPVCQIGKVLSNSSQMTAMATNYSSNYKRYQSETFHCFGDPSMRMYTKQPTEFSNVSITRGTESVSVLLVGSTENAYIAFQDNMHGGSLLVYGTSAKFSTRYPDYVDVCIYADNKIPYLDMGEDDLVIVTSADEGAASNSITSYSPNPTSGLITIGYTLNENATSADIAISDLNGNQKFVIECSKETNSIIADLSCLDNGIYLVTLIVDGTGVDSKQIIVQK